jgi:hypothetical protein
LVPAVQRVGGAARGAASAASGGGGGPSVAKRRVVDVGDWGEGGGARFLEQKEQWLII